MRSAKAFRAGFHRMVHRACPVPLGSSPRVTRYRVLRSLLGGEVPLGGHGPPVAGVERLDRVGTEQDSAYLDVLGEERCERLPRRPPEFGYGRAGLAPLLFELLERCPGSLDGGRRVDRPQVPGEQVPVLAGGVPQRGPDQVDHARLHDRLGEDDVDAVRQALEAVTDHENESFSGWTKTFVDPRLCAAIVDRLTYGGNIIETGTDSYRLAATVAGRAAGSGCGLASGRPSCGAQRGPLVGGRDGGVVGGDGAVGELGDGQVGAGELGSGLLA